MIIISKRGKVQQQSLSTSHEMLLCAADVTYFVDNFVKLHHPQHGWFSLALNTPQARYVKALQQESLVISKQPRRAGQTTSSIAFLIWRSMFNNDHHSVAVVPNHRHVNVTMQLLNDMTNSIPARIRPRIMQTYPFMLFDNGSSVYITSADAGANAIQGLRIDTGYIGDMALFRPLDQRVMFYEMANRIQPQSKMFISSTPRVKGDTYHTLWDDAVKGSRFTPVEVKWQEFMTMSAFIQQTQLMSHDAVKTELECEFI